MKSYKPYTILDNHDYRIYLSHNLSLHLYYTRSPSVTFGDSSLRREPNERFRSFKLPAKIQFIAWIQQSNLAVLPHSVSA